MRRKVVSFLILAVFGLTFSCRDKVICPAFQSTYILDDSTRMAYFSYAWKLDDATRTKYLAEIAQAPDSGEGKYLASLVPYFAHAGQYTPEPEMINKTKYGVVKYEPEWMTRYQQRRVPMENVLAPREDPSAPQLVDVGEFIATDFTDTIGFDSTLTVTNADSLILESDSMAVSPVLAAVVPDKEVEKPKGPKYLYGYDPTDNYNVEQEYYNKYLGEYLIKQKRPKKKPAKDPEPILEPLTASDSAMIQPVDTTSIELELPVIPADTIPDGGN